VWRLPCWTDRTGAFQLIRSTGRFHSRRSEPAPVPRASSRPSGRKQPGLMVCWSSRHPRRMASDSRCRGVRRVPPRYGISADCSSHREAGRAWRFPPQVVEATSTCFRVPPADRSAPSRTYASGGFSAPCCALAHNGQGASLRPPSDFRLRSCEAGMHAVHPTASCSTDRSVSLWLMGHSLLTLAWTPHAAYHRCRA